MKITVFAAAMLILISSLAIAQVDDPKAIPQLMSYQGCLKNNSGQYLNGNYSMTFSIWSASSGGSLLWTETQAAVKCTLGLFNVNLGSVTNIPISIFTASADRYLQLKLNVSPAESLLPRTRMTSAGFAYVSTVSDSARGLQGRPVSNAAPSTDQVLKWNGSSWVPGVDNVGSGDGNNYTTSISFSGTSSKTLTLQRSGLTNLTASFTDLIDGGNADRVDGFHATSTPGSNCILPLNSSGCFIINTGTSGSPVIQGSGSGLYGGWFSTSASNGIGLVGANGNSSGYAIYSSGNFACSGTKSAVVRTSKGPTEMYAVESPNNWFEDFGEGKLVNGRCHIELDPMFLETVTINKSNPIRVFVTLNGDCKGIYVQKGTNGFDVIELDGGNSNVAFDYRVIAKRKGYEQTRMKTVEACYTDRLLYPDDNDPSIPVKYKKVRMDMLKVNQHTTEK